MQQNDEFDNEGLKVTAELLSANPDFYTLWNYRRKTFLHIKDTVAAEELQTTMLNELSFLEQCLKINPKSYGTWHHRGWVLENMPEPDWKNELRLCNKFLEFDERNFHCWDYRRLVVKEANITPEEELQFTTNKIESNFSNYSSWHYRSKLLPLVYGDNSQPTGMKEEQLISECMLVQNAFFTDPSDQSAWFYHRWLLGRVTRPLRLESILICRPQGIVVVGLSHATELERTTKIHLAVGETMLSPKWRTANGESCSTVWICDTDVLSNNNATMKITVELQTSDPPQTVELAADESRVHWLRSYLPGTRFRHEISAAANDVLTQELTTLQQLHDLEPENKWVLLTVISLMRALDPLSHENETFDYINKLIEVDPMRTSYYLDLKSKFIIENALESRPPNATTVDLSNKGLTTLVHADAMVSMETVNLSHNSLQCLPDLGYLQGVRVLNLDGNKLSTCKAFYCLSSLEELSICDNMIKHCVTELLLLKTVSDISTTEDLGALKSCTRLTRLHLKGNPVCEKKSDIVDFLMSLEKKC
ncbi:hypothetical protein LSH36_442g02059 [Paralvinella palmiformis]|uniref:Geranylgeranyl transferase type-2 subunit alpha n=1 Tax=Paralvinella palmiformis TaxID=53620 RepID=A0AAD9JBS4_9ANNE|nr:hypothetical protein LSH36_442g02059 [Paralvinella palmiformis]